MVKGGEGSGAGCVLGDDTVAALGLAYLSVDRRASAESGLLPCWA